MFENIRMNRIMVEGAYKRIKSYYYHNKNYSKIKGKIAEFEADPQLMNNEFDALSKLLLYPRSKQSTHLKNRLLDSIDFIALPKKYDVDNRADLFPVTNSIIHDKKLIDINFFIDCELSLYILDTIWALLLGKIAYDNQILSYDVYGNTLNDSLLFADKHINFTDRKFFNIYFPKYTAWRDGAFNALEKNYNSNRDSLLISLDIKSYYYSVRFNIIHLREWMGDHSLFDEIKHLTGFMGKVYSRYTQIISKYRKITSTCESSESVLPIGLFSSMVLGNVYLAEFDRKARRDPSLLYYGRYVDDVLLVYNKTLQASQTNESLVNELLVENNLLTRKCTDYVICGRESLVIQNAKLKTLYIDHNESKAIIDMYNEKIRVMPSQIDSMDFKQKLNDFDEVAYTISNLSKETKIRDLENIGINSYKINMYFAFLASNYVGIDNRRTDQEMIENINHHIKQITKFFNGSHGIEYYTNWLNYLYFLVVTKKVKAIKNFKKQIGESIKQINCTGLDKSVYKNMHVIRGKLKKSLMNHLQTSIYLSLSLDGVLTKKHFASYLVEVNKHINSNMFNHNLVALPLANYLNYADDVSLPSIKVCNLGEYPDQSFNQNKFIWSPRFIHLDEIVMARFYNQHNRVGITQMDLNEAVNDYCRINHITNNIVGIVNREIISFDDYTLRNITVGATSPLKGVPEKILVAVGSTDIPKNKVINKNNTFSDKCVFENILKETNEAFRKKNYPKLLVLPEMYLPIEWLGELVKFVKKSQIATVVGMKLLSNSSKEMHNYLVTILPFECGEKRYKTALLNIREKNDYSPIEIMGVAKEGYLSSSRKSADYFVYSWQGINMSSILCYELTDITVRAILKGKCDVIALPVYNPDTTYFSNIIDSAVRDLHVFIIQSNTSRYGDSRVSGPYSRDNKDIIKMKGGENDHVVIGTIYFKEVKEYEKKYYDTLDKQVNALLQRRRIVETKKTSKVKPLSARFRNRPGENLGWIIEEDRRDSSSGKETIIVE